ncbi:hypothetical protein ACXWOY_09310, partial [Streptococcus pyogenes]
DKTRESYAASGDGIGNYKDLLSTVIAIHHGEVDKELTKEEQTFWSVAVRYLRKKMAQDGISLPHLLDDVTTSRVSDEVMA